MNIKVRQNVLPVLAAMIWGTAFVAQSVMTDILSPFTVNASRSIIAAVFLGVFLLARKTFSKSPKLEQGKTKQYKKNLILGGILCGTALFAASNFQQLGLGDTSAGKAGFITALYIVIVPIFGIFIGKKAPITVWIAVFFAVIGLYFLCVNEEFKVSLSDFYVLICALIFAVHILVIDHFTEKVDGVELSFIQFITCFLLSFVCSIVFENDTFAEILSCALPILYIGVFSSGVAYTLQIIAQKGSNPTVVSILLSLESVFSVIAGALFLGEKLMLREIFGCVLMMAAVVLAQIEFKKIPFLSKGK